MSVNARARQKMQKREWSKLLSNHRPMIGLFAILAVALALRAYGIRHDLPFVYDQDEPMFVTRALTILKNQDLNPHWFGPPATTTIYLLALVYALIFAGGIVVGIFRSPEEFKNLYYSDPTVFYLSGRLVSVLFGIAAIWLVYKIGRRLFNPATGIIAAAILAISPIHISLSQQVRMDTQMAFLILLAYWFCLNILEKGDWTSYLLAGFFTGVATVTKYPAIVFSLTIALSHVLRARSLRLTEQRRLIGSAAACVIGAFSCSPFLFLDFRTVLKDVIQEARPEHLAATGEGLPLNILWYLRGPLPHSLSVAGLALALIGIVLCLTSRDKARWTLVSFPIFFLLFISSLSLRWDRWILPVIPFMGLLAAFAITHISSMLLKRFDRRVALAATAVLLIAVLIPMLRSSILQARETSGPYTSTLARQWMLDHIAGSRVLIEVYAPPLPASDFKVFVVDEKGDLAAARVAGSYSAPDWEIGRLKDAGTLAAQNIQYFVMTGYYQNFLNEKAKYPHEVATYEALMRRGELVYDVEATPGKSRGPRVRIFKLNQNNEER